MCCSLEKGIYGVRRPLLKEVTVATQMSSQQDRNNYRDPTL